MKGAGLKHSVYADDITISGSLVLKSVIWNIKQTIHKHGFKIKAEKELSLINSPADITGAIINGDQIRIPNRQLKRLFELRAERHLAKDNLLKKQLDAKIAGHIAQRRQVEESEARLQSQI